MSFASISATGRFPIAVPAQYLPVRRLSRRTTNCLSGVTRKPARARTSTCFSGVVGGKVNIGRGVLVNAGVLFPLTNSGLQPKVTPYFSFEYVF